MKKNLLALILLASVGFQSVAVAQNGRVSADERRVVESITSRQLSDYLHFVASDEMEGRDTPSRGLDLTAKFIAMNLSRWGFTPAGDTGTFFQKMALDRETIDAEKTRLDLGGKSYKLGDDFFRIGGNGEATGPMVFVRDGWMVRSKGIDALAGIDVTGKVLVLSAPSFTQNTLTPRPAGVTDEDLKGQRGVDWADPVEYAGRKGAAGIIVVAPQQVQSTWARIRAFVSRGNLYPEKLRPAGSTPPKMPVFLVSQPVGEAIFAGESGNAGSSTAFAIGKSVTMATSAARQSLWTQNVVAKWEGSDPTLKEEMVAIGAHYDHVGINENAKGDDKIYNGADDDGSGTVAVLSIAEALAKASKRPKRSILFVWHCGEEKGLWGSEYFNKFPTVDIKKVVAQLNIDMIGRSRKADNTDPRNKELSDPNSIYVIGSEMMSSQLGSVVKSSNAGYLNLTYDYKYDDPKDPNRFFFRSDHYNYAVNGIPIAFWFDGVHEDYHQPGDHADKIDYEKMEKVTRTIMVTMLRLAEMKERPKVDKQLPPELMQR